MGLESPSNLDSNIEKPKTLKDYSERLRSEINRLEKLSLKQMSPNDAREFKSTFDLMNSNMDELERLEALSGIEEFEGTDVSSKPISEIIDILEKFQQEQDQKYQEKFGGKNLNDLYGEEKEEAEILIASSDRMSEIISHLIKFEN